MIIEISSFPEVSEYCPKIIDLTGWHLLQRMEASSGFIKYLWVLQGRCHGDRINQKVWNLLVYATVQDQ